MEELIYNYKKALQTDSLTDEANTIFMLKFIDKICLYSPDIRQAIYYYSLFDLITLCKKARHDVNPKKGLETDERKQMFQIQNTLIGITYTLKYKGITINEEQLKDLKRRFEGAKDTYLLDVIEGAINDPGFLLPNKGGKQQKENKRGRPKRPFSDFLNIADPEEKKQFIENLKIDLENKNTFVVANKLVCLEREGIITEKNYIKAFFEDFKKLFRFGYGGLNKAYKNTQLIP